MNEIKSQWWVVVFNQELRRDMSNKIDYDEEIRQRFAMLHLAWDEAYGTRKRDPNYELRKYLHILAGINSIWRGIGVSKHYYRMSPVYKLDSGLTVGICRCICDILINTHPAHEIPDSLADEIMEVTIELLERHICADATPDQTIIKSFENVIHVLILKSSYGHKIADRYLKEWQRHTSDLDGSVFQELIDVVGPSLGYLDYIASPDFDGIPDMWANDLYRGKRIFDFEHMSCDLCWGPNSPEVIANEEIRAQEERKKNLREKS